MTKFRSRLEERLKKNAVVYKISSKLYSILTNIRNSIVESYLRLIEFFIPNSYYLQNSPDSIFSKDSFPDFKKAIRRQAKYSKRPMRDGTRLLSAKFLLDLVHGLEEGDYAELGTYKGSFARIIFANKNSSSTLYCFDTFEGFSKRDVEIELSETHLKTKAGHFSDTSLDLVRKNITGSRDSSGLDLIKGYFPATFKGMESKKWRFVHLDADLYEPMKAGVQAFWPNIVTGGILLIHDYNGDYVGTKKAIDEYFAPLGIVPIPLPDKVGSALVIKS